MTEYPCPQCLTLTTNYGLCNDCKTNTPLPTQAKTKYTLNLPIISDEEREILLKKHQQIEAELNEPEDKPIVQAPWAYIRRCSHRPGRCKFKPPCKIFEECYNRTHTTQIPILSQPS